MIGIKDRLPNDGFPLWSLKYYVKNNDNHGISNVVLPIIDAYCRFVSFTKEGEKNETQIAEEIMDLFAKDAGIKEYLCDVYNSKNLRSGMQYYIGEYKPELECIAKQLDDGGRYVEQVKGRLSLFSSWLWEKGDADKQIDAIYLDYQLIYAINKIIPQPVKRIEDAAVAISNRISAIKMPFDFLKSHNKDIFKLMQSLISIYNTNGFKEINKNELIDEINKHGEQFIEFFINQQKVFSTCLRNCLREDQLSDDDINTIYTKLESNVIGKQLDSFIIYLKNICNEYKKAKKYNQLLDLWRSLSGGYETPAKWSEAHKTPILCLFYDCLSRAKDVFDIINNGYATVNDDKIVDAIDFLNTNKNMDKLADKEYCDKMFIQFVSGEYEMLITNINEVRELLISRIRSRIYEWHLHKSAIDALIKSYSEDRYKTLFVSKVIEKIDGLPPEKAKEYLKELIKNEPLVGIKIMKN
jgi:hypothetical protein